MAAGTSVPSPSWPAQQIGKDWPKFSSTCDENVGHQRPFLMTAVLRSTVTCNTNSHHLRDDGQSGPMPFEQSSASFEHATCPAPPRQASLVRDGRRAAAGFHGLPAIERIARSGSVLAAGFSPHEIYSQERKAWPRAFPDARDHAWVSVLAGRRPLRPQLVPLGFHGRLMCPPFSTLPEEGSFRAPRVHASVEVLDEMIHIEIRLQAASVMMRWSRRRSPTVRAASARRAVTSRSASLGSSEPPG